MTQKAAWNFTPHNSNMLSTRIWIFNKIWQEMWQYCTVMSDWCWNKYSQCKMLPQLLGRLPTLKGIYLKKMCECNRLLVSEWQLPDFLGQQLVITPILSDETTDNPVAIILIFNKQLSVIPLAKPWLWTFSIIQDNTGLLIYISPIVHTT